MSGDLKERIEEMLSGLGSTPDAVADALRSKGIRGNRDDGCTCPIAQVICAEFPEARDGDWADDEGAHWFVTHGYIRTPAGDLDPPTAVAAFIEVFDDGESWADGTHVRPYEDLEDNPRWRADG